MELTFQELVFEAIVQLRNLPESVSYKPLPASPLHCKYRLSIKQEGKIRVPAFVTTKLKDVFPEALEFLASHSTFPFFRILVEEAWVTCQ